MASLKASVLRGSLWSIAGGAGQQLANFVIFFYLARALNPSAVGLVALAVVMIEIVTMMAKLGVVDALQPAEPNRSVETALLIVLGLSGMASACLILLAAGGAWMASYDRTFVTVIILLAPIALFQAINTLPEALFKRNLNYRSLAVRNWSATIAGGIVAVVMVQHDYGVFALVGQRLTVTLVGTALLWSQVGWWPTRHFVIGDSVPVLSMGWKVAVASLSGLLSQRIMDMITGAFLGPAPLGFLRVSTQIRDALGHFVVYPITGIALTSFSRLKADPSGRARAYLRIVQLMTLVSLPIYFGMGAVAEPLISLVLGADWMGAVIVFKLLGPLMLARSPTYFFGPIMVAADRGDVIMRQSLLQALLTVPSIWIGSHWGLIGVMLAQILCATVAAVYNMIAVRRHVGIPFWDTLLAIVPAGIASAIMYGVVAAVLAHLSSTNILLKLLYGIVTGGVVYGAILALGDFGGLWRHYLRHSIQSLRGAVRN